MMMFKYNTYLDKIFHQIFYLLKSISESESIINLENLEITSLFWKRYLCREWNDIFLYKPFYIYLHNLYKDYVYYLY